MPTPEETKALLQKAEQLNEEKKYNEIIELLTDELLEQQNSAELFTERARAHGQLKQTDESLKNLNKAFAIDPVYYKAFNYRGNYWMIKGEYDKAIEDYNKAIELKPDYASAYNNRGSAWDEKGEYDKAIEDYNNVIALKPDGADAYNNRGNSWYHKGEYDKAIEDYNKAIELKPDYATAYNNRGSAWDEKGEYDKAIEDYNNVIALKPDGADAYNNRGNSWYHKGEYDKAIEDYIKAIELKPDYALAYTNRSLAWNNKGEYEKAIEDCNKAIELKPNYAKPYWIKGLAYNKLEEYEKAIENYEQAINLNADFSFLQYDIDRIKAKLGKSITNKTETKQEEQKKENQVFYFLLQIISSLKEEEQKSILQHGNILVDIVDEIRKYAIETGIDAVAHFTKLKIADLLVLGNGNKLRYSNVVNMNDPEEGKILLQCLNETQIETSFKAGAGEDENNIYLGSFLPANADKNKSHEDDLVMWRTYGKDEHNNEAAGCSIVIDASFFDKHDAMKGYIMNSLRTGDGLTEKDIIENPYNGQCLYKVLYFNKRTHKIEGDKKNKISNAIKKFKETLLLLINCKDEIDNENPKNNIIDRLVYRFISELRYFFKSADYAFENELRVIQYVSPNTTMPNPAYKEDDTTSKEPKEIHVVKLDTSNPALPRTLYVESSQPILPHIRRIYIGPKVPNPERWMYMEVVAKQKGLIHLKVQKSNQQFQ